MGIKYGKVWTWGQVELLESLQAWRGLHSSFYELQDGMCEG